MSFNNFKFIHPDLKVLLQISILLHLMNYFYLLDNLLLLKLALTNLAYPLIILLSNIYF